MKTQYPCKYTLAAVIFAASCSVLAAQTYNWTNYGMSGGEEGRAWANTDNWTTEDGEPDTYPNGAGVIANFGNFTFSGVSPERLYYESNTVIGTVNIDVAAGQDFRFGRGGMTHTLLFNGGAGQAKFNFTGAGMIRLDRLFNFQTNGVFIVDNANAVFTMHEYGKITGSGHITFQGDGTIRLNEGSTRVAGSGNRTFEDSLKLVIEGEFDGTGILSMTESTRMSGSGSVSSETFFGSGTTLAPGGIIDGTLTFNNNLTLGTGSNFEFALKANSTEDRGVNYTGIDFTAGTLSIEEGVFFNIVFDVGSVDFAHEFWRENQSWLVISGVNSPSLVPDIFTLGDLTNDSLGQNFSVTGGTLSFGQVGNDIYLLYTVPEPSIAAVLAGLFAAGVMIVLRRRAK